MNKQPVIIVWDKEGKFFQIWTSDYSTVVGNGIEHGKIIAQSIGGSYKIITETGELLP